jgi:hypothetical protein
VDTKAIQRSEEQIAELQLSITRSEAQIQILVDGLVNLAAPAVPNRDFTDQTIAFAALSETKDLATRARLRQEIRRKVARIDFWFHLDRKTPRLVTNSKNDLFPFARVISPTVSSASLCWSRMALLLWFGKSVVRRLNAVARRSLQKTFGFLVVGLWSEMDH